MLIDKKILITGGTGSLGYELVRQLSKNNFVVVYSRNEERQYEMRAQFGTKNISYRIGDIRDKYTLESAMRGCHIAIHAAAMKDLIMCEEQPTQAYLNNIEGSKSFIEASFRSNLEVAVAVSTDKAAAPSNVYGSTKYIMERMFAEANRVSNTKFCSVRFGNMIDSRGSLVSIWKDNPQKEIKLTHPEVSRFFFSVKDGALTVLNAIQFADQGDILIKKMKKARIADILRIITKREKFEIMGLYPGEKIHEDLLAQSEVYFTFDLGDYYVINQGKVNPNPPPILSTENAESFSEQELRNLIYPTANDQQSIS